MRKRALGRGIEALIAKEEKDLFAEGYRLIPTSEIKPNPYQPRGKISDSDIADLVASIKEKGIIEPIIVKRIGNQFVLAAGERRFRAAQLAGLNEVPAIIRSLSEQELLEFGLIENLHRKDLNPIEEAMGYDRLNKKFGLTHEQIARLVGKNRSTITNALRLLTLPEKLKNYLQEGKIDEGHARTILSLESELKMLQVGERIVADNLSVRATENLVKRLQKRPRIEPSPQKEANLLALEDELSKLLHTRVQIKWKKNKGTITINCYSLQDFNRFYEIFKKGKKA